MTTTGRLATTWLAAGGFGLLTLLGCGETPSAPPSDNASPPRPTRQQRTGGEEQAASPETPARNSDRKPDQPPPTASIGAASTESPTESDNGASRTDELKTLVQDIAALRRQPVPEGTDPETARSIRRRRNEKIIEKATEIIAQTHGDPETAPVFETAVGFLTEARLALALAGRPRHIDALYQDAESLYQRAPDSEAAAQAAFVRARFAHTNARRFGNREPRWLEEFARQANLFADQFPQRAPRAVSLLYAAARSCEQHGRLDAAVKCYSRIRDEFPETPQASQAVAVLRRLRLEGQPLQLAGPTLNGDFVSIDDYAGRFVLVVIWSAENDDFAEQVEAIQEVTGQSGETDLTVLGICLEEDEAAVKEFCRKHKLDWPQIFYSDPEQRGWDNPIVTYYGISEAPTFWLVGPDGTVLESQLDPEKLTAELNRVKNDPASDAG